MASPNPRIHEKPILLGFAVRRRTPSGRWRIQIRWGLLAATFSALCLVGVFALTGALYFFFKEVQQFDEVRYWDMFTLPFALAEHRAKIGDYQIEEAKKQLENGDYQAALTFLTEGAQRSPKNLEGRLLLAEFFINVPGIHDKEKAIRILKDGVPYAKGDTDYLRRLIRILMSSQKDKEVIELAQGLLAEEPEDANLKQLLASSAAMAYLYQGNFDEADRLVADYHLTESLAGVRLSAEIAWKRGAKKSALAILENAIGRFETNEPIYAMLSDFHRQLGQGEKARQYAVLRNIDSPLAVAPRIDLLYTLDLTGETERADREANAILRQFAKDERALLLLANFATDTGKPNLARRIYENALEQEFNIAPFPLLLIESHITAGNYEEAIKFSEELLKDNPSWLEQSSSIFNSLRAVAYYAVGNENLAGLYTNQLLSETNLRVEQLLAVSRRFQQLGGDAYARKILKHAYNNNPQNQAALTKLIELELRTGNASELGDYLKKLLQMRRPSAEILNQAYRELSSDRFIFTPERQELLIELNSILNPSEQAG